MNLIVTKDFEKDIKNIRDKKLALLINEQIKKLSECDSIAELSGVKKMKSSGNYYRIRIGDYRMGFNLKNTSIQLLCFMHRKDIYKYFPINY